MVLSQGAPLRRREDLAGALVLAWTQTNPRHEVSGGRKAAHVEADFRQDRRRDKMLTPGIVHKRLIRDRKVA
jgi:hypothetical protein